MLAMRTMLQARSTAPRSRAPTSTTWAPSRLTPDLMEAAGIVEWEQVHVLDVTNGARLTTYAIEAPAGSGEICINGAAAHLVNPGDLVIILNYEGVPASACDAPPAAGSCRRDATASSTSSAGEAAASRSVQSAQSNTSP